MPNTSRLQSHKTCIDCGGTFPNNSAYFVETGHTYSDGTPRLHPRCGSVANNCYYTNEAARRAARRSMPSNGQPRRRAARGERSFGVELEFIGSRTAVRDALTAAGIPCTNESYNHQTRNHWKVTTDGSVGSDGGELVSPILCGEDGREQVRKVCAALKDVVTVNRSTGLHVHHDCRDMTARGMQSLLQAYYHNQGTIDGFVAPSRRNNHEYCRPLSESDVSTISRWINQRSTVAGNVSRRGWDHGNNIRYRTINFCSYGKYGTVEIRQHQGTFNADKVLAWIDFGQAMIAWAKNVSQPSFGERAAGMLNTLRTVGLPDASALFLGQRALDFGVAA
jgi:hypothetical protein